MPMDPSPFTAWGILGILAFAIVVLCAILWKLFVSQRAMFETRDKLLMDFVDRHRSESAATMTRVADTVSSSQTKLGDVLSTSLHDLQVTIARQQRRLDEVLMTGRVLDKIEAMRKRGADIDETMIEKVVRSVWHEKIRSDES